MAVKLGVVIGHGFFRGVEEERQLLQRVDVVIAADAGALYAMEMGRRPEAVVGDLDSLKELTVSSGVRVETSITGCRLIQAPAEKNETDMELALDEAIGRGCTEVVLLGALGGRLDHSLANLQLLASAAETGIRVWIQDGSSKVYLLLGEGEAPETAGEGSLGEVELSGRPGEYVSLLPFTPEARGVTTEGLKYPLRGEVLYLGRTRGVSNELVNGRAKVTLGSGKLLVIQTGVKSGEESDRA